MRFRNRLDAGLRLSAALRRQAYVRPVVLGIPRGGVPVAEVVARELKGDLGVAVSRKLRAPGQPELAIGAVAPDGTAWINDDLVARTGADARYLDEEIRTRAHEAAAREKRFDGRRIPLKGRDVLVVDDGIATGATAIVAVRMARAAGAARVILAVPVGPPSTLRHLRREVDEVVCLHEDDQFEAVGQYYDDFRQVEDDEAEEILRRFRESNPGPAAR
jgi:predicted phosphoribosyltransferase